MLLERVEQVVNGFRGVVAAEVRRQLLGVRLRAIGRESAGHGDAPDIVRAEGVDGDGSRQGGVDAAGQAEDCFIQAVFARVVAQAQDAGVVHLFVEAAQVGAVGAGVVDLLQVQGRGLGCRKRPVAEILAVLRALLEEGAVGGHDEAPAIEDEVVLRAHLVQVHHWRAALHGALADEIVACVHLPCVVRAAVDGDQHIEVLVCELGHRTTVAPDVLADGDADTPTLDIQDGDTVARCEETQLVKHPVGRQEVLVVRGDNLAAADGAQAVVVCGVPDFPLLRSCRSQAQRADDNGQAAQSDILQAGSQASARVARRAAEGIAKRQIVDWIPRQGHLREHDDVGAVMGGFGTVSDDLVAVALDVAHERVDLGHRESN